LTGSNSNWSQRAADQRALQEPEPAAKEAGQRRRGGAESKEREQAAAENKSYHAEGIASWYGRDFHGRPTANREVYDMHSISAAHPTMPLPSYARVTNLQNGRSIIVRVNNRGPFTRGRVVDVSVGAAKALDFHSKGVAKVRVEYVGPAPAGSSDDRMLMATLRQGSPAPAPSKVMVASAKPFAPNSRDRPGDEESEVTSAAQPQPKSVLRSQSLSTAPASAWTSPPLTSFAPMTGEGSLLGLMTGRGLY
jgi:rare lipoprotein A